MAKFNGVPGGGELWKIGNKNFLVYFVPGQSRKIPMLWRIGNEKQVQQLFGEGQQIKFDKRYDSPRGLGAVEMGFREELTNTAEHPFRVLMGNYEREVKTRPWLKDPEVFAHVAAALLEGREVSENDLKTTNYWRTRTKQQRDWLVLKESDPRQANEFKQNNINKVQNLLQSAGAADTPQEVIDYLGSALTNGRYSEAFVTQQIRGIADPYYRDKMDRGFRGFFERAVKGDDQFQTNQQNEEKVRGLVREWLGPLNGWSDNQIARWAGEVRNEPGAQDRLAQTLAKQRKALFSEYEDESLTYEDIAAPWRGFVSNLWGETPDETDPIFDRIIRQNDGTVAREMLIKEGLKRGNRKVTYDLMGSIEEGFGGAVSKSAV